MKIRRLPLIMEKPGAHLMQLGVNHWALVGRESVTMRRVEVEALARWVVSMDNRERARWDTPMSALAHAYALATGHSEI